MKSRDGDDEDEDEVARQGRPDEDEVARQGRGRGLGWELGIWERKEITA